MSESVWSSVSALLLIMTTCNSYYISYNSLRWTDAETFCVNTCGSHLASIPDTKQYNEIINLLTNDPVLASANNVIDAFWIGLSRSSISVDFAWSDSASFDFATNVSGGAYPWSTDEPSDQFNYVQLDVSTNFRLQSQANSHHAAFICNDCTWNQINKYIIAQNESLPWADAETYCSNAFGTTLASLHTTDDMTQAQTLCQYASSSNFLGCWLGLNDIAIEGSWVWTDGTDFDFGTLVNGNWPWATNQPDNLYEDDAVGLWDFDNYYWCDFQTIDLLTVLCNQPNALCYPSSWLQSGSWAFSGCEVRNNNWNSGTHSIAMDISDNQWRPVVIEYMWQFQDGGFNYYFGKSGIVLHIQEYDSANTTHTLFVGLWFSSEQAPNQFSFAQYDEGTELLRRTMDGDLGGAYQYYTMRIELTLNGLLTMDLIRNDLVVTMGAANYDLSSSLPSNYFISAISVQNVNINTDSKFVYINGEYNIYAPTSNPSPSPTNQPSISPTELPSVSPSASPSDAPTVRPSTSSPTVRIIVPNPPTSTPTMAISQATTEIEPFTTTMISSASSSNFFEDYLTVFILIAVIVFMVIIIITLVCCLARHRNKKLNHEATEVNNHENEQHEESDHSNGENQVQQVVIAEQPTSTVIAAGDAVAFVANSMILHQGQNDQTMGGAAMAQSNGGPMHVKDDSDSNQELYVKKAEEEEMFTPKTPSHSPLPPGQASLPQVMLRNGEDDPNDDEDDDDEIYQPPPPNERHLSTPQTVSGALRQESIDSFKLKKVPSTASTLSDDPHD